MCHLCPGCAQAPRAWVLITGAYLHLGMPKAPQCPVPLITQTLPKSSLSSFLPWAHFPWQCSLGKAAALTPVWCDRGTPSTDGAHLGLVWVQGVGRRQQKDDSRTGTACFYPKRRRSSSTRGVAHHPNRLTCPNQSVAWVQQLNLAKMVQPVSINPDPNWVFFMTEATA